jgi:hypothetical protein
MHLCSLRQFFLLAAALMGLTYAADKATIFQALEDGKLSLLLEGFDNGAQVRLTMTNTSGDRFSVVLPAGQTRVEVSPPMPANGPSYQPSMNIVLDSPKEKSADLEPGKATPITANQAGRVRLISGRVTITKTPAGKTYKFENARTGIPEAK